MGLLNVDYGRVTRALEGKVRLDFRSGRERVAWYVLDGKRRFRVRAPKIHPGDLHPGTAAGIRNDLKLTTTQFRQLVACPISGADYEQLIRQKIAEDLL
ncbi:MAG: hypothetical protein Q8P22_07010 [Chloroflexota bacterium]|nr:hypothetical protein [Chloroflexota bacterium]